MAAFWHLYCSTCADTEQNVPCSMFDIPVCPVCSSNRTLAPCAGIRKSGIFPFTVNHVDGNPMEIRDMQHLRQVERNYGVAFSAFNKSNINDTDPMPDVPRYRGDELRNRK